jgi:hypothetical protein
MCGTSCATLQLMHQHCSPAKLHGQGQNLCSWLPAGALILTAHNILLEKSKLLVVLVNGFLLTNENMVHWFPLFCRLLGRCGHHFTRYMFCTLSWEKIHYEKDLCSNERYYSLTKNFILWCPDIYSVFFCVPSNIFAWNWFLLTCAALIRRCINAKTCFPVWSLKPSRWRQVSTCQTSLTGLSCQQWSL